MYNDRHVTVIIPALNEAPSIAHVVNGLNSLRVCNRCQKVVDTAPCKDPAILPNPAPLHSDFAEFCACDYMGAVVKVVDRIVVGDNGSTDCTAAIASAHGAMCVHESERGYGAACLAALAAAPDKDLIVFVDGDHSVAPQELPLLLEPLVNGADLVIGSRTLGHCEHGALSVPQVLGNQLASYIMRLLWQQKVTDLGPFRAITDEALNNIGMTDKQFGWTVEMQVRAMQLSLKTLEVPVSTHRRIGRSKISGTLKGVAGAAHGILGTIGKLYWRQLSGAGRPQPRQRAYPTITPLNNRTGKPS